MNLQENSANYKLEFGDTVRPADPRAAVPAVVGATMPAWLQ
jgi:hypothetical protein